VGITQISLLQKMEIIIQNIFQSDWKTVFIYFLLLNIFIFAGAIFAGKILVRLFRTHKVCETPESLTNKELILALSTVFLNAFVTLMGWFLWRGGIIELNFEAGFIAIADFLRLFFMMDLLMYLLHRLAHVKPFYKILHQTHHSYTRVRPLTLFILNPVENLSFGLLWILVLCLFPTSWYAAGAYLTLNLIFGLTGHLGVEFIPAKYAHNRFLRHITTSTFHAFHHQDLHYNFGFYTTIWDSLFKTLASYYFSHFGKLPPVGN